MFLRKNKLIFLTGVLFLLFMAGCANDKSLSNETGTSNAEPVPSKIVEKDIPDKETAPKEYNNWAEAYLDILAENSIEIKGSNAFIINSDGAIDIRDVFGDGTPELMYIYGYKNSNFFYNDNYAVPCLALKIFSYSKQSGIESMLDSMIFYAAGGPNNYCVYLTCEGELMLYHSDYSGDTNYWGVWQIASDQNTKNPNMKIDEYAFGDYGSDLAKLYYARFPNEDRELEIIYKSNGEDISEEQYGKTAKVIMEDIAYVIFPGINETELYDEDLWKGVTPYQADCMTYDEAVAWLQDQIINQVDDGNSQTGNGDISSVPSEGK